jgi:hypothetical protein
MVNDIIIYYHNSISNLPITTHSCQRADDLLCLFIKVQFYLLLLVHALHQYIAWHILFAFLNYNGYPHIPVSKSHEKPQHQLWKRNGKFTVAESDLRWSSYDFEFDRDDGKSPD